MNNISYRLTSKPSFTKLINLTEKSTKSGKGKCCQIKTLCVKFCQNDRTFSICKTRLCDWSEFQIKKLSKL